MIAIAENVKQCLTIGFVDVPGAPGYKINREPVVIGRKGYQLRWQKGAGGNEYHGRERVTIIVRGQRKTVSKGWLLLHTFKQQWPGAPYSVDHINRNPHDHRLINLRWATPSQQQANQAPPGSRYKAGVWVPPGNKGSSFLARIWEDGTNKHLGWFKSEDSAHAAYVTEHKRRFREFSYYWPLPEELQPAYN